MTAATPPAGKQLVQFHRTYAAPRSGSTKDETRIWRASMRYCGACAPTPGAACPNTPARKVPRDRDEFLLAATAQSLRKLAKLRPMTALA